MNAEITETTETRCSRFSFNSHCHKIHRSFARFSLCVLMYNLLYLFPKTNQTHTHHEQLRISTAFDERNSTESSLKTFYAHSSLLILYRASIVIYSIRFFLFLSEKIYVCNTRGVCYRFRGALENILHLYLYVYYIYVCREGEERKNGMENALRRIANDGLV